MSVYYLEIDGSVVCTLITQYLSLDTDSYISYFSALIFSMFTYWQIVLDFGERSVRLPGGTLEPLLTEQDIPLKFKNKRDMSLSI